MQAGVGWGEVCDGGGGTDSSGQPSHALPRSSPSPFSLSSFLLPHRAILLLAGELAQLHLPMGLQELDLAGAEVAGKATFEWMSLPRFLNGVKYGLRRPAARVSSFLTVSFSPLSSFLLLVALALSRR